MKTLSILLLITTYTFSQTKGIVVDENNLPIPYVNIWVENKEKGATTNEAGVFEIDCSPSENLIISAIGYEKKITPFSERITLKKAIYTLDEVVVSKPKDTKEIEIGYFKYSGFRYHMNYFINAVFFNITKEDREKYPFIKKIKFVTLSKCQNAIIRIYFVESTDNGSPSERLLSEEIMLEVKNEKNKNEIDLSKYKINIPDNGFFIVFEKLKIEQNKYIEKYIFKDKDGVKKERTGVSYQPEVPLSPVEEEVGWYKKVNDKWEKSAKIILKNPNSYENIIMKKYHDKYLVPSVNIILSN